MKCIVDAQLPKSLSVFLNSLGADAIHTLDLPDRNRTGDDVIIRIAADESRTVITKDEDFLKVICCTNNLPNCSCGEHGQHQ
jgi:predicted nuclease of predicted toxin-antitoxin system